jgi:vacuolar protein sorting-associated protein IST1
MDFLFGFQADKFKPYCKMAVQRLQIAKNKKTNAIKMSKREIARLLADNKEEKARIKVESVIREDHTIEAYELLELYCDLLHERARLIASERECPDDLRMPVSTIIWAANRAEVAELLKMKEQLTRKFGQAFVDKAMANEGGVVNERVLHKLTISAPTVFTVQSYLRAIAGEHNVEWTPSDVGMTEEQMMISAMPPPSGFSVPMAPGTNYSHLYTATDLPPTGSGGHPGNPGSGGAGMPVATPLPPGHGLPSVPQQPGPHVNKEGLIDFRPPTGPCPDTEAPPPFMSSLPAPGPASVPSPYGPPQPYMPPQQPMPSPYDIPAAPSTVPVPPPADLPHAPSSGSGHNDGAPDYDELSARFNKLRK